MHPLETLLWGFLGSASVELITLFGYYTSKRDRLPARYRKVGFWVTRFVLAVLAGALAVAYEIDQRILAFNIGAATPLIITFMTKGLRQPPPAGVPPLLPLDQEDAETTRATTDERNSTRTQRGSSTR